MVDKKMEALDVHEQSIGLLHNMMNIHIEENIESKLQFLGECLERNAIIDKASKPIVQMKYPSPVTKLKQDRELENLVKEFKQKPKGKRRTSVQTKPAPIAKDIPVPKPAPIAKAIPVSKPAPGYKNTPSTTKDHESKSTTKDHESKENEHLSKTVKHNKTKAVFDKPEIMKSPQLNKSMKSERARHSQSNKGSNSKGNNQSDLNLQNRDPPKVVQDALSKTKAKTDTKGTTEFISNHISDRGKN
jgi:hypothetical protein